MNNQIQQIAERMKELREILDISRQELAERVGITAAEYSAYEEATADIPVSVLYSVAQALDTDPTVLMTGEAPRMDRYTVVRQGQGVEVNRNPDYRFSSLAFNFMHREMEPMLVTLSAGDREPELVFHEGQEFNYVVEGSVIVTVGNKSFTLHQGDSIYFDAILPHSQTAAEGTAKFLTVINENAKGLKK